MIDSKLDKMKAKSGLGGSEQNIIDFKHTYSKSLKGILVWTTLIIGAIYIDIQIINYNYAPNYAPFTILDLVGDASKNNKDLSSI